MSHTPRERMTLAAFSRAKRQQRVRADCTFLLPSPPRPQSDQQHGHSTTQDREPVSDRYTPQHYHGG